MSRYSLLELQQQQTVASIRAEGVLIALIRKTAPVADGAGGFAESTELTTTLPAKKRYLGAAAINVRSGNTREFFQDDTGERYQVKYVIIGAPGDDIQQGDFFYYVGELMRVVDVHPDRTYEVRGQIVGWTGGM